MPILPMGGPFTFSELLPNGELAILEGHHHGAPLDAPDVVAQKTVEFIDRDWTGGHRCRTTHKHFRRYM